MLITLASETVIDKAREVAANVLRRELASVGLGPSAADDCDLLDFALEQASDVDLYRYATTQGREGSTAIDAHLRTCVMLRYCSAVAADLARQFAPMELPPFHFGCIVRDTIFHMPPDTALPAPSVLAAAIAAAGPSTCNELDGTQRTGWCRNGRLHRDPCAGPALIVRHANREVMEYHVDGVLHRPHELGPAMIEKSGDTSFEIYYRDGIIHRPASAGPAEIMDIGSAGAWIAYKENGSVHRPAADGPAYVFIDPRRTTHGDILPESDVTEYREHGELHRPAIDGPAEVYFNLGDGALCLSYWENGNHLRTFTEVLPC